MHLRIRQARKQCGHAYPAADLRWLPAQADGNDDEERWGDRVLRIVRR
jgi:hypothetical protein